MYMGAGKPRTHGFINKGGTIFCKAEYVDSEAARIFNDLTSENRLRGLPFDEFVSRLVYYASEFQSASQ